MPSDPNGGIAVSVEGLGKAYLLGEREPYKTLRSSLRNLPSKIRPSRSGTAQAARQELWAIRDLSFELHTGEVLGVVGHNGAGKSTLLKILSRVTSPTEGEARLHGRASALLEVGTGFHPELTGRENVFLNGAVLGMTQAEIRSKFDEIVDFSEVADFIDTPIKRYSSGMQVRLAFAVAAFLEPEILIVDEVLAVGDAAFQRKCLGKLSASSLEGRTVLFVSHNLPAVRSLCSRAILLDHGRLLLDGTPDAVIDRYLTAKAGNANAWDLTAAPRTPLDMGGKVHFHSLRLVGASEAGTVKVGQELRIAIEFDVLAIVEDLVIVLNILTVEDVLIAQSVTTNAYAPISRIEPGRYVIEANLDNALLQPGRYAIGLGARSGSALEDSIDVAGIVEFVESSDIETWFTGAGGYLRLPVEWSKPEELPSSGFGSACADGSEG